MPLLSCKGLEGPTTILDLLLSKFYMYIPYYWMMWNKNKEILFKMVTQAPILHQTRRHVKILQCTLLYISNPLRMHQCSTHDLPHCVSVSCKSVSKVNWPGMIPEYSPASYSLELHSGITMWIKKNMLHFEG